MDGGKPSRIPLNLGKSLHVLRECERLTQESDVYLRIDIKKSDKSIKPSDPFGKSQKSITKIYVFYFAYSNISLTKYNLINSLIKFWFKTISLDTHRNNYLIYRFQRVIHIIDSGKVSSLLVYAIKLYGYRRYYTILL